MGHTMKRLIAFLCLFFIINPSFALFFIKKNKNKEEELPPMVHTVDEWLEEATNLKMDMRKRVEDKTKKDERLIPPEDKPKYIEKYNVVAGRQELNLTKLFNTRNVRSPFIIAPDFESVVYSETYFYPQTRQAASTVYMLELDGNLSKKEKVIDASIFEHTRYELISTALPYLKNNFFSTLTIVDFSKNSKILLLKEKRGSQTFGNYETYAWLFFFDKDNKDSNQCYINNISYADNFSPIADESFVSTVPVENISLKNNVKPVLKPEIKLIDTNENESKGTIKRWYNTPNKYETENNVFNSNKNIGYGVKLNLLNAAIKTYFEDNDNLLLNLIRWDINPLGFNSKNENEIIVQAVAYKKDGTKALLGYWAVNVNDGIPRKMTDNEEIQIDSNAFAIIEKINDR